MDKSSFCDLFDKVSPLISKEYTIMRRTISECSHVGTYNAVYMVAYESNLWGKPFMYSRLYRSLCTHYDELNCDGLHNYSN